jgi:signal peptidase I
MPTGSMEDTLLVGDRIAVWRTYGAAPQRGEIVTHIYPVNRKDTFVKRVVGIPGDRIRMVNKQLFVNGAAVAEPYVIHRTSYMDSYRDNFPSEATVPLYPGAREMLTANVVNGEVVVPPGHYFVLGDNRDSSLDSRYWGFIAQSDIIGIPKFVYYSVDAGDAVAAKGQLEILRVRWNRIFRKVS